MTPTRVLEMNAVQFFAVIETFGNIAAAEKQAYEDELEAQRIRTDIDGRRGKNRIRI
jgi:hypothetical protein